jgi:hypothetical protein
MNDLNQRLQSTFLFSGADLRANRSGRLSPRQQNRLRAAGGSQRLALAVFVVVMAGTLAVILFGALLSSSRSGLEPGTLVLPLAIIAAVIGGVILIGLLTSRRYMLGAQIKQMVMAQGPAAVGRVRSEAAQFEIRIGAAKIRLLTQEQLEAFQPAVEYRVFYLPGPAPMVLSAEVIGTEAEAEVDAQDEPPVEQDAVIKMQRQARSILIVLAALVLGIPLLGFAASALPAGLRWAVWVALLAVAVGFAYWALRRLGK